MAGENAYQTFVLSCQAFISDQEGKEEVSQLGILPPLFPSRDIFLYLSVYHEVCLTPSLYILKTEENCTTKLPQGNSVMLCRNAWFLKLKHSEGTFVV